MKSVLALWLALAATPLLGQGRRPNESPELAAAAVLRADRTRDWRMLLALAHPDALIEYRRNQIKSLEFEGFGGFPGGADPCMVKQIRARNRFLLDSVFRVPTIDSLARMAPESVFAREQRQWAGVAALPDTLEGTLVLIGHVMADDSTAYVIIEERFARPPTPDWPERMPRIMTFRAYRNSWRSMLDGDIALAGGSFMMTSGDCQ